MPKQATGKKSGGDSIPDDQWDLPVTFDSSGDMITLRELKQAGRDVGMSLASLTPEKRAELTIKRIEAQPRFELAMLGAGLVDKERAIREVQARSEIGRVLIEIEQRVISHLLETTADR